jgi:hypothetical protein
MCLRDNATMEEFPEAVSSTQSENDATMEHITLRHTYQQ